MSTDIYIVALPLIGAYFGASLLSVQATMLAFVFGLAFAHLFIGGLADHFGRRRVALTGLMCYLFSTCYATFAPSIEQLTLARFIQGMATATGPIVMRAIVRDLVPAHKTGQAYALTGLIAAFGPILAPLTGSIAVQLGGWRMSLGALLIYGSFVFCYTYFLIPETLNPAHKAKSFIGTPFKTLRELLRSRDFRAGAGLIFLGYGALYSWLSTGSYILIDALHYGQKETGAFIGSGAACFMLGTYLSSLLQARLSVRKVLCLAGGLGVFGTLACAWLIGFTPPIGLMFLGVMPFYVGWGIMQPIAMATAMRPFAAIAGQASAWFGIAQFLGAGCVAFIAGLWGGGVATFLVMAVAMVGVVGIGYERGLK